MPGAIGISGGAAGTAASFIRAANISIPFTAPDVGKADAGIRRQEKQLCLAIYSFLLTCYRCVVSDARRRIAKLFAGKERNEE